MTPPTDVLAVEAEGLVKVFGETSAVDGLDLIVPANGVYGVLGPNGAGKTTTIRILATLTQPDGGRARIFGKDVAREAHDVRRMVSLTGQFASIDEDLSGAENLVLLARLLGHSKPDAKARAEQLLHAFGLTEAAAKQAKHYSGGMRRRLDIAASIVVTPKLLFLDEPTTGLDPRSRNQVWEIVRALVDAGTTVLLTTQHLEEADQLASRIAVIDHGKVIAEGTPADLKSSVGSGALHVRVSHIDDREAAYEILASTLKTEVTRSTDPAGMTARVDDNEVVGRALTALSSANIQLATFAIGQPSLDEVFLTLTGKHADEIRSEEAS
jgi:ABC-2 type transport system ATP-binding protein